MKALLFSLAAVALVGTSPAAANTTEHATATVRYDDLRLATPQGQKALERRLTQAARKVCGLDNQKSGSRIRTEAETECFRTARATAMQRHAALVERHQLGG